MKEEPIYSTDYSDREVRAVGQVLVEIGQVLGAYRTNFVVVGGAVPWLLLEHGLPPHIGTLDIDLNLNPDALGDGEYASLVRLLEAKGYQRGTSDLKTFQLRRYVRADNQDPVVVLVDLLLPRDAKTRKNRPALVEGLRVQGIDGGAVAFKSPVWHRLEGTMPDGRKNSVDLQVASIPAFLVMKGYALIGRDKMKDAYDIYYAVRHSNPVTLAEGCRNLLSDPEAVLGFRHIASKFASVEDYGPVTVRRFLLESDNLGAMTAEQLQTDAFFRVENLLRSLDVGLA